MKIKGIRHVGIAVDPVAFSEAKKLFITWGGKIINDNVYDSRPGFNGDIHTCKIQFEDDSIIELTTDINHIAFNVDKVPKKNWEQFGGYLMELVKCKKK